MADEIIYVDHLSTDGTYEEALELSKIYDNLKVFRYDREIPKPGPNYQKNIISIGNSISQYYNFCISKATKKTIFKWDADFIANRKNLKDLISEYSLRTRCDKFSMWFTGETIFIKDGKKYINKNSYYDEYRGFSIINGVKWSDAIRCEYVDREYADNSISLRFEKPCFYEVKRIDIDEFENREGLIDKRDQQDYEIIQNLINNINIPNLVEVDSLNEKVVLTYGTFDTFHFGHLEILRRSKELGDRLIVGLSTDEFNIEKNKNSRFNFEHRKKWIESIKYVDLVIPEESWNQKVEDIRKYNVDIFVMGDDWKGKFDDLPCKVIYLPRTENISSTEIKKIINPTSMNEINNLISNICNDNLRQNQIKMLKTFKLTVEALEINNIDYWLGYGTLIGCLRHGGFVPWDDDIDLCILKKDFEKFVNIKNNKIEIIKYHDELYRISHNEKSIDIFILEENHEKTLEMTIDEIFPLKRSKFNGIDCYIPNNPEDFFKRKYGNINPMEDCLVWNHEVNNMWISGFEMKKYQIKFKDLDDKWKKYIL
jgi:glycerol-3-phosphate cytidylyltransferase